MDEMQRLRRDLRKSDDQNVKLKAELESLKKAVRDATRFAKTLIDDMRRMKLRRSATLPAGHEHALPPGNWAECKTEIQQEDDTFALQLLVAEGMAGITCITGVKRVEGGAGGANLEGVNNLEGIKNLGGLEGGESSRQV